MVTTTAGTEMTVYQLIPDYVIAADCSGIYVYTYLFATGKIFMTACEYFLPKSEKC